MLLRRASLVVMIVPLGNIAGLAQSDPMHLLYQTEANQLGVVEYCRSRGWADDATIEAQKKIASILPAPSDSSGLNEAENDGKRGTLVVNGAKVMLADMTGGAGSAAQAICTQLGDTVKAVAANLQNISTIQSAPGSP
jgi:hypothetical protein